MGKFEELGRTVERNWKPGHCLCWCLCFLLINWGLMGRGQLSVLRVWFPSGGVRTSAHSGFQNTEEAKEEGRKGGCGQSCEGQQAQPRIETQAPWFSAYCSPTGAPLPFGCEWLNNLPHSCPASMTAGVNPSELCRLPGPKRLNCNKGDLIPTSSCPWIVAEN